MCSSKSQLLHIDNIKCGIFIEVEPMKDQLEKAVKQNAEMACKKNVTGDEAMKYTQAALNAANALRTLRN